MARVMEGGARPIGRAHGTTTSTLFFFFFLERDGGKYNGWSTPLVNGADHQPAAFAWFVVKAIQPAFEIASSSPGFSARGPRACANGSTLPVHLPLFVWSETGGLHTRLWCFDRPRLEMLISGSRRDCYLGRRARQAALSQPHRIGSRPPNRKVRVKSCAPESKKPGQGGGSTCGGEGKRVTAPKHVCPPPSRAGD
ncbi:hypothetical protein LZ31DRAFT_317180 [Colletotrichum somersetense]|nr:hypothetical protein LZ31DRAFT_317180 [Colletotrichum somersetense]